MITSAKLALEMGLRIWGIAALTATASDKIGRSVTPPGQGILTLSREDPTNYSSPLLNLEYRRRQLQYQLDDINTRREAAVYLAKGELTASKIGQDFDGAELLSSQTSHIDRIAHHQRREALNTWGNEFWKRDPTVAPLRSALATWGLTIEDLNVASLHGTSTQANDKVEGDVICKQLRHLGRSKGNVILGICQKYLTGDPKGPAGA